MSPVAVNSKPKPSARAQQARPSRPLTASQLGLTLLPWTARPEDTFGAHLLATLDSQLRILLTEQRTAGDANEPESVHQMRVATRRLRVALRSAEGGLDEPRRAELESIRSELAWLNGLLGPVRDLDVLSERLHLEAETLSEADQTGFAEIDGAIEDERTDTRETLTAGLAGRRYRALLRALARLIRKIAEEPEAVPNPAVVTNGHRPPAAEPAGEKTAEQDTEQAEPTGEQDESGHEEAAGTREAPEAEPDADPVALVRRPIRKLRKQVAGLNDPPAATELHQVRIRAKRVRYAAEQAAGLTSKNKRLTQLAKAARQLQDVLGEHHDTVAAEQKLRELAEHLSPDGALVIGRLVEREYISRAERESEWRKIWHRLERRAEAVQAGR
ncbi:MAG TPA: CHAD domain-containing protein [Pseudonocardiaceae bacterium]